MKSKFWYNRPASWRLGLVILLASIATTFIKNTLFKFELESFLTDLIIYGITSALGSLMMYASTEILVERTPEMKLGIWLHRPILWKIGLVIAVFFAFFVVLGLILMISNRSLSNLKGVANFLFPLYFARAIMLSCSNKVKVKDTIPKPGHLTDEAGDKH